MKEQLSRLKPYQPGKQVDEVRREYGLDRIEKLASNENPFGSSPGAKQAIEKGLTELMIYPDGHAADLRGKVSRFLNVRPDCLIFGNGSDEILHMVSRAFIEPGTNSIMADPTFSQYKRNVIIEGGEAREVPLDSEGNHDLERMLSLIDDRTRVIWICNPNNPTGRSIDRETFISFMERVPKNIVVVSDEAYSEYVTSENYPNTIDFIDRFPNLIATHTFSKIYGLAGLRIGYGVAHSVLISELEHVRDPFNVSRLSQAAAAAALDDQNFVRECAERNAEGKKQYYDFCKETGIHYFPTDTNFILMEIGDSGEDVFQYMVRNGYIIRSGSALGCPEYVRITIGTKEQNAAIIKLLKDYVSCKQPS
ncbi:histidinol-phosphate transaminase [Sporolactobacillus putidus]|uniref:Histidinol-phosphate aminotransferase n=1 Tax=Sporolactobacillus putidus TaxID=492735 RepID=A0A917RZW7_9BACL|nr:histidinol-phosphate transaminase [Sporolactobacillus putidus]GGL47213.1 histidinol-phosphate aminotransferase [Sporolactobacillus putidus]